MPCLCRFGRPQLSTPAWPPVLTTHCYLHQARWTRNQLIQVGTRLHYTLRAALQCGTCLRHCMLRFSAEAMCAVINKDVCATLMPLHRCCGAATLSTPGCPHTLGRQAKGRRTGRPTGACHDMLTHTALKDVRHSMLTQLRTALSLLSPTRTHLSVCRSLVSCFRYFGTQLPWAHLRASVWWTRRSGYGVVHCLQWQRWVEGSYRCLRVLVLAMSTHNKGARNSLASCP